MKTLGIILKKFFLSKKEQYWLCIPKNMDSKRNKELFIMDTLEFLTSKIKTND